MRHLGEKETIDIAIPEGQSSIAVVFVESYLTTPHICIVETDGPIDTPANVTTIGCDINAINSKTNPVANTDGRTMKLSICK